jgi:hypothetical protein
LVQICLARVGAVVGRYQFQSMVDPAPALRRPCTGPVCRPRASTHPPPTRAVRFRGAVATWCAARCAAGRVLIVRGGDAPAAGLVATGWRAWRKLRAPQVEEVVVYERRLPAWTAAQRAGGRAAGDGSLWLFSSSEAIANLQHLPAGPALAGGPCGGHAPAHCRGRAGRRFRPGLRVATGPGRRGGVDRIHRMTPAEPETPRPSPHQPRRRPRAGGRVACHAVQCGAGGRGRAGGLCLAVAKAQHHPGTARTPECRIGGNASVEARALARQAQDLARETAARQAVTDARWARSPCSAPSSRN